MYAHTYAREGSRERGQPGEAGQPARAAGVEGQGGGGGGGLRQGGKETQRRSQAGAIQWQRVGEARRKWMEVRGQGWGPGREGRDWGGGQTGKRRWSAGGRGEGRRGTGDGGQRAEAGRKHKAEEEGRPAAERRKRLAVKRLAEEGVDRH